MSLRLSIARGVSFGAFALCLLAILLHAAAPPRAALWGAPAAFALFLALALIHDRRLTRLRRVEDLRRINEEGAARLERAWDRLPLPAEPPRDPTLAVARDLDLFGRASLFHLLGTAHTPSAKALLRDWLLGGPPAVAEIAARQAAVAELAPRLDWRQGLEQALCGMERHPPDCEPFLRWAEDDPWLLARPALLWTARLLTAATALAATGALAGAWTAEPLWLLVLVNLGFSFLCARRLLPLLGGAATRREAMLLYAAGLREAAAPAPPPFVSPRLAALAAHLAADGEPAHAALARLETLLGLADLRHAAPLHFIVQALVLWDFHVLAALEAWRQRSGRRARGWLAALGEIEALAALGALAFDEPDWSFPALAADEPRIAAEALGHPLLPAARRVVNDVAVGPAGTFLLVTGSNMSGKSTLLRAIGLNVVLAQAGAPVCAARLRLPPVRLATSILVEDSLAAGVSFFLAELLRIKAVVAAADAARGEGLPLLYLLDEVLRGTNSAERRIAVLHVLRHLLARGALGAVSTHDLELTAGADAAPIAAAARPVHFRETLSGDADGPRMSFDYRLRPGVATTTNALELLRQVGLDLPRQERTGKTEEG